MSENEQDFEGFDGKIPVNDKRRFNAEGERVADDEPIKAEPVASAAEMALEAKLKAETERREAAESKLVGVQLAGRSFTSSSPPWLSTTPAASLRLTLVDGRASASRSGFASYVPSPQMHTSAQPRRSVPTAATSVRFLPCRRASAARIAYESTPTS